MPWPSYKWVIFVCRVSLPCMQQQPKKSWLKAIHELPTYYKKEKRKGMILRVIGGGADTLPPRTSMISGATNLLSVIRVTTVSVNVLLVIVSVTRPGPVGAGGNSIVSGFRIVTVVTDAAGMPLAVSLTGL